MNIHDPSKSIIDFFSKGRGHLVPVQRQVTNKQGNTFTKTVWVNPNDESRSIKNYKRDIYIPNMTKNRLEKILSKKSLSDDDKDDLLDYKYFMLTDKKSAYEKGLMDAYSVSQSGGGDDGEGHIFTPKNKFWITNINNKTKGFNSKYFKVHNTDGMDDMAPIGGVLSPDIAGMRITKYSEKAILITGDTYVNKEDLRAVKKEIGSGSWNRKLQGWVFPIKFIDSILGILGTKQREKGNDEKANAIINQKNESLTTGDDVKINGEDGIVSEGASDGDGTKYNIKLADGTELNGVDDKVIDVPAEKDDKKISNAINNAQPENRIKTIKKIYGIKSIDDVHEYSLEAYMKLHGLTDDDIKSAINMLTPSKNPKKRSSGGRGGRSANSKEAGKDQALSKRQFALKLIRRHRMAVEAAVNSGVLLSSEVLKYYPDLSQKQRDMDAKQANKPKVKNGNEAVDITNENINTTIPPEEKKTRKPMSEETKRKISEALKRIGRNEAELNRKLGRIDSAEAEFKNDDSYANRRDLANEKKSLEYTESLIAEDRTKIHMLESGIEEKETTLPSGMKVDALDLHEINHLDIIFPRQKGILDKLKPNYIPYINYDEFKRNGHTLPITKLGPDKYLVELTNGKARSGMSYIQNSTPDSTDTRKYAIMTMDLYATTLQYYKLVSKEKMKLEVAEDQLEYDRRYGVGVHKAKNRRIKVMSKTKMSYRQHDLIKNTFENDENKVSRSDVWKHHREVSNLLYQKIIDLELQREYVENAHGKGQETSYGKSNLNNDLLESHGIQVKRQNGDEIKQHEIDDIKKGMDEIFNVFGSSSLLNKDWDLTISHSGNVLMHARKAVGIFHPSFNAIGVSKKNGENEFNFTFAHEYGHFMDYMVGKDKKRTFASDIEGSAANMIASTFRKRMNAKQSSDYQNRTCECFARAFEQYFAIKSGRSHGYFAAGNHVSEDVFTKEIVPLIEMFLLSNRSIIKSFQNDLAILGL